MTDLERWKAWLTEFGIVFTEDSDYVQAMDQAPTGTKLVAEANAGPKNEGYSGFVTVVMFDANGKFMFIGAYE